MKIKTLFAAFALSALLVSCGDDDSTENQPLPSSDARISAQIDAVADDVSVLAEILYVQNLPSGRLPNSVQGASQLLPACAQVATTTTATTWTSTVNFGEGCTLYNGNVVSGTLIVTGSTVSDGAAVTLQYSFDDFHHNNRQVEGDRTVVFTWESTTAQPEVHQLANIHLDLTITYPNGISYDRAGHRIREMVEGYNTPNNWYDNQYEISGSWNTTLPSGILNTTIGTPLHVAFSCAYVMSGTLNLTKGSDSATLDYGDGTCDSAATLSVNGREANPINLWGS